MAEIQYDSYFNDFIFKTGMSREFVSPASQDVLRRWGRPAWEPSDGSRDKMYPYWNRIDPFRPLTYYSMVGLEQEKFGSTSHGSLAIPSGDLYLGNINYYTTLILDDAELYHYEVQRLFCLFSQFDTLLEHQISSFLSIPPKRVQYLCWILYSQGILKRVSGLKDLVGTLWILDRSSQNTYTYIDGMDTIYQLFSFGNFNMKDNKPPGAGSSYSIKHNIHTVETLLRLAECGDNVAGVWGDMFAGEELFHKPVPHVKTRRSHGDGVIVTKDGSVIILETTGSSYNNTTNYESLVEKAASWIGVIATSHLDLSVLFVDSTWDKHRKNLLISMNVAIRKRSRAYVANERDRQKALSHLGVVNLMNWFPDDNTVSRAATRLLAWAPSEFSMKAFDTPDEKFSDEETRRNVVINTTAALHTPTWIREEIHGRDFHKKYPSPNAEPDVTNI